MIHDEILKSFALEDVPEEDEDGEVETPSEEETEGGEGGDGGVGSTDEEI